MANRRRNPIGISLFPFLSILACIIGTLTLVIAGVILGEAASPEVLAAAEPNETDANPEPSGDAAQEARSTGPLEVAGALAGKLEQGTPEERRGEELFDEESKLPDKAKPRPRVAMVVDYFDPEDALRYKPSFVVCESGGVLLDAQMPIAEQTLLLPEGLDVNVTFEDYLRKVKATDQGIVIFLIRPGGVRCFEMAKDAVDRVKVKCGEMPVPAEVDLDFRRFAPPPKKAVPGLGKGAPGATPADAEPVDAGAAPATEPAGGSADDAQGAPK